MRKGPLSQPFRESRVKPLSSSSSHLIQNHQFAQLTLSFFGSVHNFTKQFALCKEVFAFFHDCNCFVTPPTAQTQEIFTGKTGFVPAARSGPVLLRRRSVHSPDCCIVILLYSQNIPSHGQVKILIYQAHVDPHGAKRKGPVPRPPLLFCSFWLTDSGNPSGNPRRRIRPALASRCPLWC